MYNEYFGLKENPFGLSPDPRYLYLSQRHQDALAHLMYGITGGGGFVLLTGEVGTGKTLMIRALLQRLPETVDVALVLYPFLSVREFMLALCDDLHIAKPADPGLKSLLDALNTFLLENHAKGRRTVLFVDEAHRLKREVLEQIRLLTNLETTKEKLLQIVLVGQPELNGVLAQPEMRQLTQRITARYDLQSMTAHDTHAYVQHRCRVAGATASLFSGLSTRWIHRITRGVPRLINILCDRALLAAYARGRHRVGLALVRVAAREVESTTAAPRRRITKMTMAAGLAVAAAGFALWRLMPNGLPVAVQISVPAATATPVKMTETVNPPATPGAATAGVPQEASASAARTSPPAATLKQLLADPAIPTDTDTAFEQLFAHWGLKYAQYAGDTGCERAQQAGLRCLFESGTWNSLRLLNRPAIIELADDSGARHHVLVSHLTDQQVTLEFPGREVQLPLAEVDRAWFGKYLLLWDPPEVGDRVIRRGMRGAAVSWVRDALARYGLPRASAPASDQFDAELEDQVKEFQRRHQIQDDGVIGQTTLAYLRTYDSSTQSPQITAAREVSTVR